MKVTNGGNPYAHQRKTSKTKHKGFSDMYSQMSAHKSGGSEKQANVDMWSLRRPRTNSHQDHGTQIIPDSDWINTVGQPNMESKGDAELSGQQIFFLQTHYDIENLTPEARHNLLCDLTDMGVLSAADLSSEDQSKVDNVLETLKSFKMGVISGYVEAPEQPELLVSDGSDPELRGLSDDEKFAAIVKKHEGGTTGYTFHLMISALSRNKLITREQFETLSLVMQNDYAVRRTTTESAQGYSFNLELFDMNYRVTMDNLLKEATRFKNFSQSVGQPCEIDEDFLREFASKFKALS